MDQLSPSAIDARSGPFNIAGRLERLPLSRFHILACAIVGAAMFFDGYDIALTGLVMPSLVKVGLLTEPQRAWLMSLSLLSAAIGAVLSGIIGDRYGRRRLLIANILVYGLMSPACGLAQSYPQLLALRMVTMLALGMQVPAGYCYLSELAPKRHRGRLQSVIALLINGSLPAGAVVAWVVVPSLSPDAGWRALFFLSALVLPLALSPRSVLPESPRWLASVGRLAEADRRVADIETQLREQGIALADPEPLPAPIRDLGWSALFEGGTRSRFGLAVLFQICHLSAVFVFASWLPTILMGRGFDGASAFGLSGLSFAGGALGPFLAIALSDRFERRRLLLLASCVAAAVGFLYPLHGSPLWLTSMGLVLTTTIYFISAIGFGIYLPEILPTGVRLRGMGTATLIGRLSSALTPFAVSAGLQLVDDPLSIMSGVGALYLLMVPAFLFLGPDTAGRSLEALEHANVSEQQNAPAPLLPALSSTTQSKLS